jgi:site-specific DNA-methyltransferase (adenine-specific)
MKAMPDNSVDAIVTDPPYELGFMGKSWDASGIAFNIEVWQEALRVIKPGGHLIAFSGSRTYHRMAVAIEDAGFQIRDQIMWVYGSGFPKSHNISKAIDKAAGAERERVPFKGGIASGSNNYGGGQTIPHDGTKVGEKAITPAAQQWDGWGTALKPAHEPMVLARKPLEGTVANNVLTYGVGGLNIDGTRVGSEGGTSGSNFVPNSTPIYGKGFGGKVEIIQLDAGRFPANFIHDGSDEVVGLFPDTKATGSGKVSGFRKGGASENAVGLAGKKNAADGFSDSGSAARFFYCAKASKKDRNEGLDGFEKKQVFGDDGGTYQGLSNSKVPSANHHPTVKPTALMQYLVRLVTPLGGIVLDPFMGSGSTGKACAYEGFEFIGIDQSAEYVAIAQARIDFALAHKSDQLDL